MELIKKKILLEDLISRSPDITYGTITATTLYFKLYLTQTIDDLGIMTDAPFVDEEWLTPATIGGSPNVSNNLVAKILGSGVSTSFISWDNPTPILHSGDTSTLRLSGSTPGDYFKQSGNIEALTDSKELKVRSYNALQPYVVNFDIDTDTYVNYQGQTVNGVTRVVQILVNGLRYTIDANNDSNIGTTNQTTGLAYTDDNGTRRIVTHTDTNTTYDIPTTTVKYVGEGWNETNTTISATTKEEYLIGISEPPEVLSDIFIDRGALSVMDRHMRLAEIKTISDLTKYGNGYYNIES